MDQEDDGNVSMQISTPKKFISKAGKLLTLTPYLINFKIAKLHHKLHPNVNIIPDVSINELLHAVSALYNMSLPEMSPDTIYEHLSDHSKTIVLLQDNLELSQDWQESSKSHEIVSKTPEKDICPTYESPPNFFSTVFSDNETVSDDESDGETEEDDDEENFSEGCHKFLNDVHQRRLNRINSKNKGQNLSKNHFGVENRIAGAITISKRYIVKVQETVHHLKFLATRMKYRKKFGIGKYLLNLIRDKTICGNYEGIVVHADNEAIPFFKRFGFTDDIILNSRYGDLMEQFTNCTLMSYSSPFTDDFKNQEPQFGLSEMDKMMNKWRSKTLDCFQEQSALFQKMQREVIHLKAVCTSQNTIMNDLQLKCDSLEKDKSILKKSLMKYQIDSQCDAMSNEMKRELLNDSDWVDEINSFNLAPDSVEFKEIQSKFFRDLKNDPFSTNANHFYVKSISKLKETNTDEDYMQIYFCHNKKNVKQIFKNGFNKEYYQDLGIGEALYFTEYPYLAFNFSDEDYVFHQILLCKINGKNSRSISESTICKYRGIFNLSDAIPIALIEFF